jgi:hypothetical protein
VTRHPLVRASLLIQLICVFFATWSACAAAQPGAGPRETVNQRFTTTRPSSPTGLGWTGVYHAAGNPRGNPPYMRRMTFYPPRGMRYDTSVPDRCSAPDAVLEVMGPAACPPGSRIGGGSAEGIFFEPIAHSFVFDHYKHTADVLNGANQQIILIKSEGYTVVRGRTRRDGSTEFDPPTCFPAPPAGRCVDDYVLQLRSSTFMPAYKKTIGGRVRSYATTPASCPARGYWRSTVRFWWAGGAVDSVVTKQPCRRRGKRRRALP